MDQDAPLSAVLDDLAQSGREEAISIGEVLDAFQHRSVAVLITVFALIALLPLIGDIPGMSIVTGSLILIAIVQHLVGGTKLWMPDLVRRQEMSRRKFDKGLDKTRPVFERVEALLKPRLEFLVAGRPNRLVILAAAALLAITFYPLAFVPFGVNAPAAAVLALGLGLLAYDGLFVLIGYAAAGVTVYVIYAFLPL